MKIAVIADEGQKEELLVQGLQEGVEVLWFTSPGPAEDVAGCIDLLFDNSSDRIARLQQLNPVPVFVNNLTASAGLLPANFIPFNGWKGFLKRNIVEAACDDPALMEKAGMIMNCFNKKMEWVPGTPGFISARVVSMIINEAYLALEEGVSTREEIDTAMKLGTNYPHGPFEWGQMIGLRNVHELLVRLAENNSRYQPSELLQREAAAQ